MGEDNDIDDVKGCDGRDSDMLVKMDYVDHDDERGDGAGGDGDD